MAGELTPDEEACLLIMAEGGSIAPIARWEKPVYELARRGLATRKDAFNYIISGAGRERVAQLEKEHDAALGGLIERSNQIGAGQKSIRDFAEQIAQKLVQVAEASADAMGDAPSFALEQWLRAIRDRARELLREKNAR